MGEEIVGSGHSPDQQNTRQPDGKTPAVSVSGRTGIHTLALVAAGIGGTVLGGSILAGAFLGFGDNQDADNVAASEPVTITTVISEPTESGKPTTPDSEKPSATQTSTAEPHSLGRDSAPAAPAAPRTDTHDSAPDTRGPASGAHKPVEDPDAESYGRHSHQSQGMANGGKWEVRSQSPACGFVPGTGTRGGDTYLICSGQTLSAIATEVGVGVDELVRLNGITDPNLIYAGAALRLPS